MGQIVMVVAADNTSQHALNQALATIESCEIVMMVLNKASRTDVGAYYGYYGTNEPS
jgi:receptor protein-tyrosine kinase